jgi:hypothetical protein
MRTCYFGIALLLFCIEVPPAFSQAQPAGKPAPKAAAKELGNPLLERYKFFSARVTGGIANDHDRKIYRSGHLMRADFDDGIRISDLDTLGMWGIHGERCFAFTRPDGSTYPFSAYRDFKAAISPNQEEEIIDGHKCQIETVTLTKKDFPMTVKMRLWEAEDLGGFPIKIEVEPDPGAKIVSTYTDVSVEPPDPKLFAHPANCDQNSYGDSATTVKIKPKAAPQKDAATPANPPQQ